MDDEEDDEPEDSLSLDGEEPPPPPLRCGAALRAGGSGRSRCCVGGCDSRPLTSASVVRMSLRFTFVSLTSNRCCGEKLAWTIAPAGADCRQDRRRDMKTPQNLSVARL